MSAINSQMVKERKGCVCVCVRACRWGGREEGEIWQNMKNWLSR